MRAIRVEKPFTFEGITVEGGWIAEIPSPNFASADPIILRHAAGFRRFGMPPAKAFEVAIKANVRQYEVDILKRVKNSVGWYAKVYFEAFGDLRGYDATVIAKEYVPYDAKFWGRRGKAIIKKPFADMRRKVS